MILSFIIFFSLAITVYTQDISVYGKLELDKIPIDDPEIDAVYATCFGGMALTTCLPNLPTDGIILQQMLPYYVNLKKLVGVPYCLECCGTFENNIDVWNLTCSTDYVSGTTSNKYGYQFRFAAKRNANDRKVVTCPLKRSQCTYDKNELKINCDRMNNITYLHGYILKVHVVQYYKGLTFWRGVESCSAQAIEKSYKMQKIDEFSEVIYIVHPPLFQALTPTILGLLGLLGFILIYIVLYLVRRSYCIICANKLVFCCKICTMCQFVGATPPDKFLMEALDEKNRCIEAEQPVGYIPGAVLLNEKIARIVMFFSPHSKIHPSIAPTAANPVVNTLSVKLFSFLSNPWKSTSAPVKESAASCKKLGNPKTSKPKSIIKKSATKMVKVSAASRLRKWGETKMGSLYQKYVVRQPQQHSLDYPPHIIFNAVNRYDSTKKLQLREQTVHHL